MRFALLLLFLSTFLFSKVAMAQEFNMPPDITKLSVEDCEKYRGDIINCIKWLQSSPVAKDKDKRHVADAFLLMWISHSKELNIELLPYLDKITDIDPELISLFMGGWALNVIEKHNNDMLDGNYAGLKSILDYYNSNKGIAQNELMDKLLKREKAGKLKEWIQEQMNIK